MDELISQLQEQGLRSAVVPVAHLRDLEMEIAERCKHELDPEFARTHITSMRFGPPEDLQIQSIIIVAVPRPQHQAVFTCDGQSRELTLPPTYVDDSKTTEQTMAVVGEILSGMGYHIYPIAPAKLPLKLLAVRSGLGRYGRNNVCYVPGLGSFHQLVAMFSDLPAEADPWGEAQMLERCQNCQACRSACPTGAIATDRFLLHAERCLTYHNEKPAGKAFPAWINPAWHNALFGCMLCQRACPENRSFRSWIGGREEFSSEETGLLLAGTPADALPVETFEKLARLDLLDSLDVLPRNVGVFF